LAVMSLVVDSLIRDNGERSSDTTSSQTERKFTKLAGPIY